MNGIGIDLFYETLFFENLELTVTEYFMEQ